MATTGSNRTIQKNLTPLGAWAFSIGTSIGWGSLVVTASTYLAQAGPMGSVLGLVIGTLIMLVISRNYAYMMRAYPDAGGVYAYTREIYGYDHGFLAAWFLAITYFAILWANATSLPLFCRIFLADRNIFHFVRLYTLFNYDVYLGEALLSIAVIVLFGLLCARRKKLSIALMIVLACLFTGGIVVCFVGAILNRSAAMAPACVPDSSAISQIIKIAVISPWAFIGFESISHGTEEFSFESKKIHRVLLISVVSTLLLYAMVTLLSVTAYPARYANWLEYIRDLDHLSGIEALPAFYAANAYLGGLGTNLLMLSLLALIVTSLIGNITALSRLLYALAKDRVLPARFAEVSDRGTPANAIRLVVLISCLVPFVGRTAIGWIVDVTTIGATLIYGFISACTMRMAKDMNDRRELWTGRVGLGIMLAFGAYILIPNIVAKGSLATETYFLFITWSVLGFLFFRSILQRDRERRFGSSTIVWIALLSLVLFVSLIWMRQSMIVADETMQNSIHSYYEQISQSGEPRAEDEEYIQTQIDKMEFENLKTMLMAVGMFSFAMVIMMTNHAYLNRRARESELLANIDTMTGVKNKHAFSIKEKEFDAAIAQGGMREFSVVVCDVNGLKKINDTLGHKAGDEYICEACRMVCDIFKHSPVYRIGGDEFVVVLTDRDHAIRRELMTVIHERSAANITAGGAVVSGGMSEFDPDADRTFHAVFERADAAMYEEKQLLKSMGAATRDDESEKPDITAELDQMDPIINVSKYVLIVDDEEINRLMLGNILSDEFEILYATDGAEALDAVREHLNDLALMLLDLKMPRMDGNELLKIMKSDAELKRVPVIVLTADQQSEVECLKNGAIDFIPKPYPNPEIIRARVNKCIELCEDRDIIRSTERDSLTKLFNIDYFIRYVNLFDQHYPDEAMDALVLNVNRFRILNERYGKQFGDVVLRRLGEQIRALARRMGGVCCRQGADAFLIYCPHQEDYETLLNRVVEGLDKSDGAMKRVRLRLGVYSEVDKSLEIERRFDRAKVAADNVRGNYAKAVGVYDEKLHEEELFKARLLEDFHASIEQNCFTVFFQPKFDVRPEKPILASAEALVRWKHPEFGMISPAVFIPLLEENGLILDLDRFVWRETAAQIRAWKDKFGFSVPVSVNVSRIDMLTPNLKDIFGEILQENRLTTDDIMLEITESAYAGDSEQVISTARELRGMGMGFRIEMDDFGTGYSSLGMLSHLPIDALKLDMTFVRNAFGEKRDVRMIELIIDIADYLHVPVVAEGVETEEQYLMLKAMGCDLIQGYYFSKPVPADAFDRFLAERGKQGVEVTPEFKKTYMTMSMALTSNFESIYYIDSVTDFYLEFFSGADGDLQIRPGGEDFFGEARNALLADACDEDRDALAGVLSKENLIKWLDEEETCTVSYRRRAGSALVPYLLQTIRTRNRDSFHIVIGIRPEP